MWPSRLTLLSRLSLIALLTVSAMLHAAPKSELQPYWQTHASERKLSVDHRVWQSLLERYLVTATSGPSLVNYAAFSASDQRRLADYIDNLAQHNPLLLTRPQQMAYWLNLYNALTVQRVLEFYPVDSIKETGKGFFSFGPWNDEIITINQRKLSLNDIEHGILRPIWQDPRIHYAVNCASIGCPNLLRQAFTKDNLEPLLEMAAKTYINSQRGVNFQGKDLILSSIYDWFKADFGGSTEELIDHLSHYATPSLRKQLNTFEGNITYHYDWSLNASQ